MTAPTMYQRRIRDLGITEDPRHVEASMRTQYGTLDHLDAATFAREATLAAEAVAADRDLAEQLAKSYRL